MRFLTDKQEQAIMNMNRQELIDFLCQTGYIHPLPAEMRGDYLFGKTNNDRAVCLIWNEENNGCLTSDGVHKAYHEITSAKLKVPFLFFGLCSLYVSKDLFTFAQLPWFFGQNSNPVLRTLQGMNMGGNLHIPIIQAQINGATPETNF